MSSSLPSVRVLVLVLLALSTTKGVHGCSVTPSAAAVVAGDDLSLTCTAQNNQDYVDSWRLESDLLAALVLYQAPSLNPDGSTRNERMVANGYFVNDSDTRQVILTIPKPSTSQANYYYCVCTRSSSAFAYVSIVESEPTFSNATEITDGEPVTFTCSVSFNGTARTSIIIEDSSENDLNTGNYDGTSKGLHSFSLDYNVTADSNIYQQYICNIKLTTGASNTEIYLRKLNVSVHWLSVQNVQISPIDKSQCLDGKQCAINQTVNCTAEGNPKPVTFQWLTSINGSGFTMTETRNYQLTFNTTGNYAVQCIAFNEIIGRTYNSSSSIFTAQVVMQRLDYPIQGEQTSGNVNNTPIIVGVVVGVGAFLIILGIAIFLIVKRKKSRTVCCNPNDKETSSNHAVELSKHHNGTNSFSTDNGVQNKSFVKSGNDEVTLVENDLYGKQSKTQIDPSDGGYASVNEVMQQSK